MAAVNDLRRALVEGERSATVGSVLNVRATLALDGYHASPQIALIELLISGEEISPDVRERIAEALAGINDNHPRLTFSGGVGPKSSGGLVDQRREWLSLADDFHKSGLSQPEYLKSGRMGIDPRSRKLLQDALAFHRAMLDWAATNPPELRAYLEYASEDEHQFVTRGAFCCFAVEQGLLDMKSLRDFLRRG